MSNSVKTKEDNNQIIENKDTSLKNTLIRMPKNVRQIGHISETNSIVYVEDYVMTYMRQMLNTECMACKVAILLGYYVTSEENKKIFIKGAVELRNTDFALGTTFTNEDWTSIYEHIKEYFADLEIVGWAMIGSDLYIERDEKNRRIQRDNFPGMDIVMLKLDIIEKEEAFYFLVNNQFVKQTGYYIYYEKNEDMQNYMVDCKKDILPEEKIYIDKTTPKIRNVIKEKKEKKEEQSVIPLLYSASTILAIIVLVIAATMLHNYDQIRNLEVAVNSMSENISQVAKNSTQEVVDTGIIVEDTSTLTNQEQKDAVGESNGTDPQKAETERIDVETVSANLDVKEENTEQEQQEQSQPEQSQEESDQLLETDLVQNKEETTEEDTEQKAEESSETEETEEVSSEMKYYVVKSGDSLVGICLKLYGSANNMSIIMDMNGVTDENKIFAGQELRIP